MSDNVENTSSNAEIIKKTANIKGEWPNWNTYAATGGNVLYIGYSTLRTLGLEPNTFAQILTQEGFKPRNGKLPDGSTTQAVYFSIREGHAAQFAKAYPDVLGEIIIKDVGIEKGQGGERGDR